MSLPSHWTRHWGANLPPAIAKSFLEGAGWSRNNRLARACVEHGSYPFRICGSYNVGPLSIESSANGFRKRRDVITEQKVVFFSNSYSINVDPARRISLPENLTESRG